jgi:hypothetical protein
MITYIWTITQLDCLPTSPEGADYVTTAHWQCNGTDGTYNGSVYSTTAFTVVQGPDFTPYEDLTQDQVLGWIWSSGVDKDSAELAVDTQIQNQINPPIVSPPLPWAV